MLIDFELAERFQTTGIIIKLLLLLPKLSNNKLSVGPYGTSECNHKCLKLYANREVHLTLQLIVCYWCCLVTKCVNVMRNKETIMQF